MSRARKTAARKRRQRSPVRVVAKNMKDYDVARLAHALLEHEWSKSEHTARRALENFFLLGPDAAMAIFHQDTGALPQGHETR